MTLNEQVLAITANADDAAGLVKEWVNCMEAEIDRDGHIWIANPMRGHWLNEVNRAKFVAWCENLTPRHLRAG